MQILFHGLICLANVHGIHLLYPLLKMNNDGFTGFIDQQRNDIHFFFNAVPSNFETTQKLREEIRHEQKQITFQNV